MALNVKDGRAEEFDLPLRAVRFLMMPVFCCALMVLALTLAAIADSSRAVAQGNFGIGGYLVRPEQDLEHDPRSIDPNATENGREVRKRKQQEAQDALERAQSTREPEQRNRRERSQERAEDKQRNRQQTRGNRGRGTGAGGGDVAQSARHKRREVAEPPQQAGTTQPAGIATAGAAATPPIAEEEAAGEAEAEKLATEKATAEKAAAEKAAEVALLEEGGNSAAQSAVAAQNAASGAGERVAVSLAAGEALAETEEFVRNAESASTAAAVTLNAADVSARGAVVLQNAGTLGKDAAASPETSGVPQGESSAPAAAATTAQTATAANGETGADPLNKMIGQMLMVGFEGTTPDDPSVQRLAAQIKSGQVGGVLFLGRNIVSPQQLRGLNAYLRRANPEAPVLLAIDQEGGVVQRLSHDKGFPEFPSAGQVGEGNDPLVAYAVYEGMAAQLASYGFNLNLGPVVDLKRGKGADIAGQERSFGAQPRAVTAFAKAFCIAHRSAGLVTALKHFPGHGSSVEDTHNGAVDVSKTWKPDELDPYRELINAGAADIVMTGHIAHRDWSDEAGLPGSLSEKAVSKILRGDLGFTGVVMTDDLEMGAVSKRMPQDESVIRAIKAGNNILLLSNKGKPLLDLPERTIAVIRKAVQAGELKREQVEQSHERIMALKQKLHAQNAKMSAKHDNAAKTSTPAQ